MEIPDNINNFLKPLALHSVDEKQLPPNLSRQLGTVVHHFQNNRGNIVLFANASDAKNNYVASLLGKHTHRDVYRVDLSSASSKHVGETEKNLLQVFEFADEHGFILLFDDVDNFFGKRIDIYANGGRYANLDIDYLLKRIEAYSGMVIFTTNALENLDDRLLRALPWRIDLTRTASSLHTSLSHRLFYWLRKRSYS